MRRIGGRGDAAADVAAGAVMRRIGADGGWRGDAAADVVAGVVMRRLRSQESG